MNRACALTTFVCCALVCSTAAHSAEKYSLRDDVKRLYNGGVSTREDAARRLAAAGPPAIPLLVTVVCETGKPHFQDAWPVAAKILGELKAEAAIPCLIQLLGWNYPAIGPAEMKSDEALINIDPAFAALVEIGEPTVAWIRKSIIYFRRDQTYMELRLLRIIGTPTARDAMDFYVSVLQDRIQEARQLLREFPTTSGGK